MKKLNLSYQTIPIVFWIALSIFAMAHAYTLGFEELHDPGPGLMPFLLGLLLFITSFYLLISSLLKPGDGDTDAKDEHAGAGIIVLVTGALLAYALLLERLGFPVTTFLLLILLFRAAGSKRWRSALIASALTVLLTYGLFTFLGIRFPAGFFWK